MEDKAWKLRIHIIDKENNLVMDSEEIITIEEIKNKIKEKLNITEEKLKIISLIYIDSEGDKNIIIDDNDLKEIIPEQKMKMNF